MLIKGNFTVREVPFAQWFNTQLRPVYPKLFPYQLQTPHFEMMMQHLKALTGKKKILLSELIGHFSIIYNETGGLFQAVREFGGAKYMFEPTSWGKISYNQEIYGNRLAGNQLKEWGILSNEKDIADWNSQKYPEDAPDEVKKEAINCDFNKYRGGGFNQLTFRDNYQRCLQPLIEKEMEKLTDEEIGNIFKDYQIACGAYQKYISGTEASSKAMEQLEKGNFEPYGNLVSGNWSWYVQNKYLPRCQALHKALKSARLKNLVLYAIDGMHLSPQQIRLLQAAILNAGNAEAKKLLIENGGADGAWGDASQEAFELLKISFKDLLLLAFGKPEPQIKDLTQSQIKQVQWAIIHSGNKAAAALVLKSGGADGFWGKSTQQAFEMLGMKLSELLKTGKPDLKPEQLTSAQIKKIQENILKSSNQEASALIQNSGGADGFWGKSTQLAFEKLEIRLVDLLLK